ncbi:flippase-like domain-containing protein [Antarcticibacterium arcticum]|uniref:Flippase-like domain-containing protein n=1 Tax=Antarcticibacterium arcticum TaxID=2585771 RepID=A0A5B8YN95_9FLAO|nr:lysylphosphatidylglycerol synthase transmembrane domain-containing protein [Antarcticibacterium arcticum]QED38307.1 flippase-like domain-containing protein [Antarcticibacterium arcticum]
MKRSTKQALKVILPLLLGVFLIWYSLKSATPLEREQLMENIAAANPGWIFLSLLFGLLAHLSRAYRWKFLLAPMGYKPRFLNSFMAVMVGYLANFGIPRSGEVLRAVTISSYEDIPFEKAFGTIISERIADFLMLLLVIGFAFLLQTEYLVTYFEENEINPLLTVAILFGLLAIGIVILKQIKRSKHGFFVKIRKFAKGLLEGMRSILKMKNKGAFIFHTFFIWIMYILMFYILIFTVPETAGMSFGVVMVAFVVGSFAISATNGGIGVYPIAIGASLLLFNISKQGGEAFGWITWGTQTLLVIVIGGLSFLFLPVFNGKK